MSHTHNIRRFRTNPIEVAVFSIITLIFVNSVYNLLYDHGGFHPVALVPMASNPLSEGRSIASVTQSPLLSVKLRCNQDVKEETAANKVRLLGPLCGVELGGGASKLTLAEVTNQTNHFQATVFPNITDGEFSTDYIPLSSGDNVIHLEFSYHGGKNYIQNLNLKRN